MQFLVMQFIEGTGNPGQATCRGGNRNRGWSAESFADPSMHSATVAQSAHSRMVRDPEVGVGVGSSRKVDREPPELTGKVPGATQEAFDKAVNAAKTGNVRRPSYHHEQAEE